MPLERATSANIVYSELDGGSSTNCARGAIVLRRSPTGSELRGIWTAFVLKFEQSLLELMSMEFRDVNDRFGSLSLNAKELAARSTTLFGFITSGDIPKFVHLRKRAVTRALIEGGHLSRKTPRGHDRQNATRGTGPVENTVSSLSRAEQLKLLGTIVVGRDPDEYLRFDQTSLAGWRKLAERVRRVRDHNATEFLEWLAGKVDKFVYESTAKPSGFRGKGSGYEFAPVWFAQFLASQGLWLFPPDYFNAIRNFYPRRLLPLVAWMSVPTCVRDIANRVLSLQMVRYNTEVLNVFAVTSLCSDMWSSRRFCPAPLVQTKFWVVENESRDARSSAVNRVYEILLDVFEVNSSLRQESHLFFKSKRLKRPNAEFFRWVRNPTPANTKLVRRVLEREAADANIAAADVVRKLLTTDVSTPSPLLERWVEEFESLLPHFQVADLNPVISSLNTWLMFLLTLPEDTAPRTLVDIDRSLHVNSLLPSAQTYSNFLAKHFSDRADARDQRAISKMQEAWAIAATRDGFASVKTNPFDVRLDVQARASPKSRSTSRNALDPRVWSMLIELNRANNYGFARSRSQSYETLYDRRTAVYASVFWPAEAILLDVILCSGVRLKTARWLDSGEGDERLVDIERLVYVPNTLPSKIKGREEGYLRLIPIIEGTDRRYVLGAYKIHDKTGPSKEAVYLDQEVAKATQQMFALQVDYNPISKPTLLVDGNKRNSFTPLQRYRKVFPLFRQPGKSFNEPTSDAKVHAYWRDFLVYAQPSINKMMGVEYPLYDDESPLFDIHSLRVTIVSTMWERGVSTSDIRDFIGHMSDTMTMVYIDAARRNAKQHRSISEAMQKRENLVAEGDKAALAELGNELYRNPRTNNIGPDRFVSTLSEKRAPVFDMLQHGLCVGGSCNTGGRKVGNVYQSVFRERACSRCRFRATGPRYLDGLIARLNILSWEIRDSFRKSRDLNRELEKLESETGTPASALRKAERTEEAFRENLVAEWCEELHTINACRAMLKGSDAKGASAGAALISTSPDFDPRDNSFGFVKQHELGLLQVLVENAATNPVAKIETPQAVPHIWREMLMNLARAQQFEDVVFRLPEDVRQHFLLSVGAAVCQGVTEPSEVQKLIEGSLKVEDFPGIERLVSNASVITVDGESAKERR